MEPKNNPFSTQSTTQHQQQHQHQQSKLPLTNHRDLADLFNFLTIHEQPITTEAQAKAQPSNNSLPTTNNTLLEGLINLKLPVDPHIIKRIYEIWYINQADDEEKEKEAIIIHDWLQERLTRRNLRTLQDHNWLNDEVVNAYIRLIMKREKEIMKKRIFCFNSYFFSLLEKELSAMAITKINRILKRAEFNLENLDNIFIPINISNYHWAFAQINIPNKQIIYHDSMHTDDEFIKSTIITILQKFLSVITETKPSGGGGSGSSSSGTSYEYIRNKDFPLQESTDCGVFMLAGIKCFSALGDVDFSARNIEYIRALIMAELILGKLIS